MSKIYKTNTISARFNDDQIDLFDLKAKEQKLSRADLLKKIVLNYLEDQVSNKNLMLGAITSMKEKLDRNETKMEFFMQLFHAYLALWFQSHPLSDETKNSVTARAALNRREQFESNFMKNVFNQYESLFSKLLADNLENEEEEEK